MRSPILAARAPHLGDSVSAAGRGDFGGHRGGGGVGGARLAAPLRTAALLAALLLTALLASSASASANMTNSTSPSFSDSSTSTASSSATGSFTATSTSTLSTGATPSDSNSATRTRTASTSATRSRVSPTSSRSASPTRTRTPTPTPTPCPVSIESFTNEYNVPFLQGGQLVKITGTGFCCRGGGPPCSDANVTIGGQPCTNVSVSATCAATLLALCTAPALGTAQLTANSALLVLTNSGQATASISVNYAPALAVAWASSPTASFYAAPSGATKNPILSGDASSVALSPTLNVTGSGIVVCSLSIVSTPSCAVDGASCGSGLPCCTAPAALTLVGTTVNSSDLGRASENSKLLFTDIGLSGTGSSNASLRATCTAGLSTVITAAPLQVTLLSLRGNWSGAAAAALSGARGPVWPTPAGLGPLALSLAWWPSGTAAGAAALTAAQSAAGGLASLLSCTGLVHGAAASQQLGAPLQGFTGAYGPICSSGGGCYSVSLGSSSSLIVNFTSLTCGGTPACVFGQSYFAQAECVLLASALSGERLRVAPLRFNVTAVAVSWGAVTARQLTAAPSTWVVATATAAATPSSTPTASAASTPSGSPSASATATPSPLSASASASPSWSTSPSASLSASASASRSTSPSGSASSSRSSSSRGSLSISTAATPSGSGSISPSASRSGSPSPIATPSPTPSLSRSASAPPPAAASPSAAPSRPASSLCTDAASHTVASGDILALPAYVSIAFFGGGVSAAGFSGTSIFKTADGSCVPVLASSALMAGVQLTPPPPSVSVLPSGALAGLVSVTLVGEQGSSAPLSLSCTLWGQPVPTAASGGSLPLARLSQLSVINTSALPADYVPSDDVSKIPISPPIALAVADECGLRLPPDNFSCTAVMQPLSVTLTIADDDRDGTQSANLSNPGLPIASYGSIGLLLGGAAKLTNDATASVRLGLLCARRVGGKLGAGADNLARFDVLLSRIALVVAVCEEPSPDASSGVLLIESGSTLILRLGVAGSGDICRRGAPALPLGINATCSMVTEKCDVDRGACATLQGAIVETSATPGVANFSSLVITGAPLTPYNLKTTCTLGVSENLAGTIAVPASRDGSLTVTAAKSTTTILQKVTLAGCAAGQGPASTGSTSEVCTLCPVNFYSQGGGQRACSTCPLTRPSTALTGGASCSGGAITLKDNYFRVATLAKPDSQQNDTSVVSASTILLPCPYNGSCHVDISPPGSKNPPTFNYSCSPGYSGFLCGACDLNANDGAFVLDGNKCKKCNDNTSLNTFALVAIFTAFVLYVTFNAMTTSAMAEAEAAAGKDKSARRLERLGLVVRILLTYLMALGSLNIISAGSVTSFFLPAVKSTNFSAPVGSEDAQASVATVTGAVTVNPFSSAGFTCLINNLLSKNGDLAQNSYLLRFFLISLLPFIAAFGVLIALPFVVSTRALLCRSAKSRALGEDCFGYVRRVLWTWVRQLQAVSVIIIIGSVAYMPINTAALGALNCFDWSKYLLSDDEVLSIAASANVKKISDVPIFLLSDYSVECGSWQQNIAKIVAWVLIAVIGIGFPLMTFVSLIRAQPGDFEGDTTFTRIWRPLYAPYVVHDEFTTAAAVVPKAEVAAGAANEATGLFAKLKSTRLLASAAPASAADVAAVHGVDNPMRVSAEVQARREAATALTSAAALKLENDALWGPVPAGWEARFSSKDGSLFYFDLLSHITTRVHPLTRESADGRFPDAELIAAAPALPPGWVCKMSATSGQAYYWFAAARLTQYEHPMKKRQRTLGSALTEALKPWWEAVILLRKLLTVLIASRLNTSLSQQLAAMQLLYGAALLAQLMLNPYRTTMLNALEAASLGAVLLSAMVATAALSSTADSPVPHLVFFLLIAVNLTIVLGFAAVISAIILDSSADLFGAAQVRGVSARRRCLQWCTLSCCCCFLPKRAAVQPVAAASSLVAAQSGAAAAQPTPPRQPDVLAAAASGGLEPPPGLLADGWREQWSNSSQTYYYRHDETGNTTWSRPIRPPRDWEVVFSSSQQAVFYRRTDGSGEQTWEVPAAAVQPDAASDAAPDAASAAPPAAPPGWSAVRSSSGAYYFRNEATGDVTWDTPGDAATIAVTSAAAGDADGGAPAAPFGWSAVYSDRERAYYFRNETTGNVSWEMPVAESADASADAASYASASAAAHGGSGGDIIGGGGGGGGDALPPGWSEKFSERTQKPFWRHVDGTKTYKRPSGNDGGGGGGGASSSSILPPGWTKKHSTTKNKPYWKHTDGTVTWSRPKL